MSINWKKRAASLAEQNTRLIETLSRSEGVVTTHATVRAQVELRLGRALTLLGSAAENLEMRGARDHARIIRQDIDTLNTPMGKAEAEQQQPKR